MKPIKCLLTILAACASLGLVSQANALVIGDAHELGFVNFGIPSGDQDRENYVNHLIGMALGSSDTFSGQDFKRSNNDFGPLADAKFDHNGTNNIGIDVTGVDYLFAKYDGPNYGSEVWYVGDLSGVIDIPQKAGKYGLSGWTLFTGSGDNVPDAGATASLLGVALMGLALLRARLQKA
jgi:hypothetical protein